MLGAPLGGMQEEQNVWQGIDENTPMQSGRSATPLPPPEDELGAPLSGRAKEENEWQGLRGEFDYMRAGPGSEPYAPRQYEPGAPLSPRSQEHNLRGLPY